METRHLTDWSLQDTVNLHIYCTTKISYSWYETTIHNQNSQQWLSESENDTPWIDESLSGKTITDRRKTTPTHNLLSFADEVQQS